MPHLCTPSTHHAIVRRTSKNPLVTPNVKETIPRIECFGEDGRDSGTYRSSTEALSISCGRPRSYEGKLSTRRSHRMDRTCTDGPRKTSQPKSPVFIRFGLQSKGLTDHTATGSNAGQRCPLRPRSPPGSPACTSDTVARSTASTRPDRCSPPSHSPSRLR